MTIRIQKRSLPSRLMGLLVLLPFFLAPLKEVLGLPRAIRYALDGAWLLLLCCRVCSGRLTYTRGTKKLALWTVLFLVYTLLVYMARFQSPYYYFWGIRNRFRYYAAFFAFAACLTMEEAERYLKLFDALFWVNGIVSLIQFFFLGLRGDHLGGLFSTEAGGNGYTNIFFLIVTAKTLLCCMEKRESLWQCLGKCGFALLIAALAELKFFFAEFLLILALCLLLTRFTWRKVWLLTGGLGLAAAGGVLLTRLFPHFSGWMAPDWFWETGASDLGYTLSGDLNRLNAISVINERWLTDPGTRLFGLGLGNCDTASFAFLRTPFYERYGDSHYMWLTYAHAYLETGWIGLGFFFGFFLLAASEMRRIGRGGEGAAGLYCRLGGILAVCAMILAVYDSSLGTEAGYLVFFLLALPFAAEKRQAGREKKQ